MGSDDGVIQELRLLREQQALFGEQQWSMHRSLVGEVQKTNQRLEGLELGLEGLELRLDGLENAVTEGFTALAERQDETNQELKALARYTVDGFGQVVERANRLETAFERFVELVLAERRVAGPELEQIKARLVALERKVG